MDKFKVPSTLHIDATRALIESIQLKIEEGSESALFDIISQLRDWTADVAPIDVERFAFDPRREDVEMLYDFIGRELDSLYAHIETMEKSIEEQRLMNESGASRIKARVAEVKNLFTDARAIIDAKDRIRTSSEFFLSDGNIDYGRISGEPLVVRAGSVALPYASEPVVLNNSARVTIIPGTYTDGLGVVGTESNGFPGNNHEVRVSASKGLDEGGIYGGMSFIGGPERHADLSAVLDGNGDTWFEYERISMRPTERELLAKNRNLDYEVGGGKYIPYLAEQSNEPLVLSVLIRLDEARWVNEIDVRPYIPTNYGAKAPKVTDVRVAKEFEPAVSVLKREPVDGEWVFRFAPIFATSIQIQFTQEKGYPTDIGHLVFEEVKESEGQRLTMDSEDLTLVPEKPIEIDGPVLKIADMGFDVEETPTGMKVTYGSQDISTTRAKALRESHQQIIDSLDPKTTRMSVRKIEAMRQVIGLRDIVIKEATYLQKGELVTKPITFDEPLKRITLEADATPESNVAGVEVRYHVSIDDGNTWHPIQPMNSELGEGAPKMYRIATEDDVSESMVPVLRSSRDVYGIRFKMTMEQVGVAAQSGPRVVPSTPELYAYKMVVETTEQVRRSVAPNLIPPRRLKGKVIGNPDPLESGGQGPSFDELTRPTLVITAEKEYCHNVPMTVTVAATHDKPLTSIVLHIDGKEVYREIPGVNEKTVQISVPISYFADRSRVSLTALVSDGVVEERALYSTLIVPCQEVGTRDIDVSASHVEVDQPWTVSGFARSEKDIKEVRLYINGTPYDVDDLALVWGEKKRVEFIKVFTTEEVDAFGFVLNEPIEVRWVAKDVEDQEWDDIVVIHYVDRRPAIVPCGQINYIGVTYYDWNKGGFQTKSVSVPNWDQEIRWFEDGRGVKVLIDWNETLASPVLMVRNGIGETGGVIIGKVEIRYLKKQEDGTLATSETIAFMEGVLASSQTEGLDQAYGDKDLATMGQEIHRTGRFTGKPRLMGLNAYVIPDFGEEYRSNVCGKNIAVTSFEPEEHMLAPGEVEGTGAQCESNQMFLIEYYDKTLGRRVLHGQKRDGESPQEVIHLPDENEHEVVLKWSDTETGVAVIVNKTGAKGLIVTALGVLVRSTKLEARYATGFFKAIQYTPEDESFAVRLPSDPLEVKDLFEDEVPVPELQGEGAMLFLKTKVREMVACILDMDDPGIKPDESPPEIVAETTLFPTDTGEICLQDIPSDGMPIKFTISDDIALQEYEIYHNDKQMFEGKNVYQQLVEKNTKVSINKSDYMTGAPGLLGKADIVFSVDTSGSMDPYIAKVIQKLGEFKQYLIDNNVDAYIGVMDSRQPNQYVVPLTAAATVSFTGLTTNGGGWEANNWEQVTGTSQLFASSRTGAKKVIVLVTDTYVGAIGQAVPQTVLDYVSSNDIQVSTLGLNEFKSQYEGLAGVSRGVFLDMAGEPDMSRLAQGIGEVTGTGETFTVIATDTSGKTTSKTYKYAFKDCWTGNTEDFIISKSLSSSIPGVEVFDRSQYLTFDQVKEGDTVNVEYRVRSGHRVSESGFSSYGTGITQVTGEFGITTDLKNYSPSVEDTGLVKGQIPIPGYAGGPSYTVNPFTLVEEDVTEVVLVIDTREEFIGYFNANRSKFVEIIQKDFSYGVEYMIKALAYDPGQVSKQLDDIHWYYKSTHKKRFHIMTVGTGGVEMRTYEDPRTFSLDWVQTRADAVWGGTSNKVFMDTLNRLKQVKTAGSNALVVYVGLTVPATTWGADSETLLRPVVNLIEEEGVKLYCFTTNKEGNDPASRLVWPQVNDVDLRTELRPATWVFGTITAPTTLTNMIASFSLYTKVMTKKIKTGVLRRYQVRYKTSQYNFWQGDGEFVWIVVLDPAHTAKYEYTNGYTDHRA